MATQLPNDFQQMQVAAKYELLKYLRGKKLIIYGALILLVLGLLTLAPSLLGGSLPSEADAFAAHYLIFLTSLAIIGITLFGSDSLATEFEHRTGLLMFTRPMKRESLFIAKFLASYAVTLVMVLAFYLVIMVLSQVVTGSIDSALFTSLGMAILYVLAVTALGFALSAFMSRGATAAILLFALMMLILPIFETVLMMADIDPWFSIHYAGEAVYHSVAGAMLVPTGMGVIEYNPETLRSALVLGAYTVVLSALALFKFKRREL